MDAAFLISLKQMHEDMISLLEKYIQECSATGMPMGIPKSVDRYANPNSDKMIPTAGLGAPTDYSKFPSINIVLNMGAKAPEVETPAEEVSSDEELDYAV